MSTKNLARTVIEGGRAHCNRLYRRHSNSVVRTRERELSQILCARTELDDVVYPARKQVPRCFDDKLAPARRWLRAQSGRPWSKVRGELCARFDTRTTAGRHILFDHLLPEMDGIGSLVGLTPRRCCFVDAHGFVRSVTVRRKKRRPKSKKKS